MTYCFYCLWLAILSDKFSIGTYGMIDIGVIINSVWTVDNKYSKETLKCIWGKDNKNVDFLNDFMILCVLCDHVDFSKNWNLSAEELEYYFTHLITKKLSPKKVWSMKDEAEMLEGKWLCRYIISDSLLSLFTKNLCYGNSFLPRKCG